MRELIDLAGQVFGRLTVIRRAENDKWGNTMWLCQCECGKEKAMASGSLTSGRSTSCGCYRDQVTSQRSITHGGSGSALYSIWHNMKCRCYNQNNDGYKNYGARGITICESWLEDFASFNSWALNNGYVEGLSIDRIDVNGNYEPDNCRWATMPEQNNNKRTSRMITIGGVVKTMKQWSEVYGINYATLQSRIDKLGLNPIDALTKPINKCACE